jgi:ABC-2 type transport system permease protein
VEVTPMTGGLVAAGFGGTVNLPPHLLARPPASPARAGASWAAPAPMNSWRLEWLRLTRTPHALALAAVYVIFGLGEPVLTKYLNKIINHAGGAQKLRISIPPPIPSDGISAYIGQVSTIGLIVVVVIAAGAFGFDAKQGLATFFRTRVRSIWQLIIPRFTVNAAAAIAAYLLGLLAAWYETNLLIGSLPVAAMFEGMLCAACFLAFAVALSAVAASIVKNTLGAVGLTVVVLLALPIAALAHSIQNWLPSALVTAPVTLIGGTHLTHYLPAIGTALVAAALLLIAAAARLRSREV